MRVRTTLAAVVLCLLTWGVVLAQKPFHDYMPELSASGPNGHEHAAEYLSGQLRLPEDWAVPHEFTRARMKYERVGVLHPQADTGWMGWATDYPTGDRNFLQGLRRLTTVDAQSVEHVVEFGDDDIYNWPFMSVTEPGHWKLFQDEADQLRDYIDRGGFLMTDDNHGTIEWANFVTQLRKAFGNQEIRDIPNDDPIFHSLFNLDDKMQVPGAQFLYSGITYEFDGFKPEWKAIRDSKGRIIVAICHNMDLSDAIENSNDPRYPERYSNFAYRLAANYVVYDLTH